MEVLLSKEYITGLIDAKGLSKSEFANRMGIKKQNLDSLLESKKKDINTVMKMADVLDIPFTEFIGMEPKENSIYGCLYVQGKPIIINNKTDIDNLLKSLDNAD